jgi:hypothetical protein
MTSEFVEKRDKRIPCFDLQGKLLSWQLYEVLELSNIAVLCLKASRDCEIAYLREIVNRCRL